MKIIQDPAWSVLFGIVAPSAGWVPPLRFLLRRQRILELVGSLPSGRLVEVGCGAGAMLAEFSAQGHDAIGLESSPRALSVARRVAAAIDCKYRLQDAPDAGWVGTIDMVCAFDVLEHIEEDSVALDQWAAWLRPGGVLCLSVPAHRRRWSAGDEWAGHYRRYDRSDLLEILRQKGMRIEHFECYGFPLANLTEWLGIRTYRRLLAGRAKTLGKKEATAGSGVDQRQSMRVFRWIDTWLGRLALRASFLLQSLFSQTNLGSGYLVLARKP